LESIERRRELLISHAGDEIEVDSRIGKRAAEAEDQGKLLRSQVVAILSQGGLEVGVRFLAKSGIGHGEFSKVLQNFDAD
jgi:hypothetical protein